MDLPDFPELHNERRERRERRDEKPQRVSRAEAVTDGQTTNDDFPVFPARTAAVVADNDDNAERETFVVLC